MAKKKSRKEQSRIVDGVIALIISALVVYILITILKFLVSGNSEVDWKLLLQFEENLNWIRNTDLQYQILSGILFFGVTTLVFKSTSKKTSGYKDASEHGAYGNAQFSEVKELEEEGIVANLKASKHSLKDPIKSLKAPDGIILGRTENNELIILPPESKVDNRNVQVVGSSGSAKGQAFVINNILNNKKESIVVTDPKGELFHLTADIKRDQGYNVYQIDFMNLLGSGYNPLDYIEDDIQAKKVALSIARNAAKDDKEDHWFDKAKDLLTGLIIYTKSINPKANIPDDVKSEFNKANEDEKYLPMLCEQIGESHPAYQYLKDASVAKGNERASIFSTFTKQVGIFSSKKVADLTRRSGFSFHDLQKEKTIIYIKIPVKDNPVAALTATFFDQLHNTLYEIGDKNEAVLPIPFISIYDEFANLGTLNDYDNILSTCRGYGWSIMTIIQDFAQLEQKYSKELARTIISNHDTTLFLRTKDTETAQFFEDLSGKTTIKFETNSKNKGSGFLDLMFGGKATSSSSSTSEQYIEKPLISKDELLNMRPHDKCYVYTMGHKIELKKAYQHMIYPNFITKQDGMRNGKPKFVYCYPEHREAHIEGLGLTPKPKLNELKESVEEETKEKPIPIPAGVFKNTEEGNVDSQKETAASVVKTDYDDELKALAADFMNKIAVKPSVKVEKQKIETEIKQEEKEEVSDEAALSELNAIMDSLAPKIKRTEEISMELSNKELLTEMLDTSGVTKSEVTETAATEDFDDELPM
ncbi:VirD4-like conjugal transfer protein, CD1115 family [Terribacillus saccharophilus]|uniref:VirD4-like conjugal transfer protein, CD1115 family n=1 Tax=Terribacillus saccharophilus TaxID=361277 RepID=UPI002989EA9B|nr:type IV secretory system conjugative DNA transfer family protein [Terribacillus saccharophilus]MCM3227571.1 type IV secretory system conjugative DNA transfer family protein [Terribacillus saccharophilus]